MSVVGRIRSHLSGPSIAVAVVGACLLAVVLSACGGSETTAPTEADRAIRSTPTVDPATTKSTVSTTSTTSSPPATTPVKGQEEEEVKAAFLATVDAYYRRLEAPDPNASDLPKRYGKDSLKVVKAELQQLSRDGEHAEPTTRGVPVPVIESVTLQSKVSTAEITFCLVDDVRIVDSSGGVINDDVSSRRGKATLTRSSDHWIIESQSLVQRWPDGKGCR